jgi:tetratricopeptide (TPR) repeat protein
MNNRVVVLLLTLSAVAPAHAIDFMGLKKSLGLGGPEFELNIEHPPAMPLKVTTVAIGKPEGECSDGVASRVEEDFVQAGLTVIDRQRYEDVVAEHKLQMQATFDQKTAARIGALLGAQALLFIKVLDCHAGKSQQQLGDTIYLYTAQGTVNGSMRVVDLTSGKVVAAQRFEGKGQVQAHEGYPDPSLAMDEAEKNAALGVHKVLLPWKETKRVVFYGDTQCDLKKASSMLKSQDIDGALKQSESNLAACKDDPKVKPAGAARAYYNLGILQFMRDDFDTALTNLTEAQKLQDSQVFTNAIADCRRAKELSVAMTKYEDERATFGTEGKPRKPAAQGKPASSLVSTKPSQAPPPASSSGSSIEDRLTKLDELKKKNLITPEEYKERRAKILSDT